MRNIKEIIKRGWIFILALLIIAGGLWVTKVYLENIERKKTFEKLTTVATSRCFDYDNQERKECLIKVCDMLYPVKKAVYGLAADSFEDWMEKCAKE